MSFEETSGKFTINISLLFRVYIQLTRHIHTSPINVSRDGISTAPCKFPFGTSEAV